MYRNVPVKYFYSLYFGIGMIILAMVFIPVIIAFIILLAIGIVFGVYGLQGIYFNKITEAEAYDLDKKAREQLYKDEEPELPAEYEYADGNTYYLNYTYKENIYRLQEVEEYIEKGEDLYLVEEPDNEFDKKAVAVQTTDDVVIGYLYKGWMQDMANDFLKAGKPILCYSLNENADRILIGFYKKTPRKIRTEEYEEES